MVKYPVINDPPVVGNPLEMEKPAAASGPQDQDTVFEKLQVKLVPPSYKLAETPSKYM